jgi:hypothetical protein
MAAPHYLPFPVSISRNRLHSSFIATASFPLTARLPPPYSPIKGVMRTPSLSTAPTSAPISPPRARNHLPIRAPLNASVEHRRVVIFATLSLSGAIGDNPNDLLSLSPSYHDELLSPGAATPPHGCESTMDRELVVVP